MTTLVKHLQPLYNKFAPAAVLAVLAGADQQHVRSMSMANASIAPVLIEAKVAQKICNHAWLDRYACPRCGKEKVAPPSEAQKYPMCRSCGNIGNRLGKGKYHWRHPLYGVRKKMIQRCHLVSSKDYPKYGGRGITVCDQWRQDPHSFIEWGLANGWKPGLHIDRINTFGNYEPSNCRFVTCRENQQNRRDNKLNPDLVRVIRMLCWSGVPQESVSLITGTNQSQISLIMRFQSWSNV